MKNLCKYCNHKTSCIELCKQAEVYVNQDYASSSEITVSVPILTETDEIWNRLNMNKKKLVKQIIAKLVADGMPTKEIAYHIPLSTRHIRRLKKYLT